MLIQHTKRAYNEDGDIGFLDPAWVSDSAIKENPMRVEDYLVYAFLKMQYKTYVLLPYNFPYVIYLFFLLL